MQWYLIRLRKEAGLTQKELADISEMALTSYIAKENGTRQFKSEEMFKIRKHFNKPLEEIFLSTDCTDNAIL